MGHLQLFRGSPAGHVGDWGVSQHGTGTGGLRLDTPEIHHGGSGWQTAQMSDDHEFSEDQTAWFSRAA